MRFTAVFATLAALAVTAAAAPASASALEQAGAVLGGQHSYHPIIAYKMIVYFGIKTNSGPQIVAQQADCKNRDSYDICRRNCSPLAPGFACTINCLIAYCP
ncbi:hypothetical protein CH35J_007710 [Colletotrichum higginsianum]|uniref:Uncharacterized protein n=1 Tax=Colletotrichum higginsianum TaxID=80884 RepID=A0A4T0VWH6_9PEZI|nr:hypothetical protein CH35J_007710 [Colletotrichum higginsianum]